jgi:ankyrin repeat protein
MGRYNGTLHKLVDNACSANSKTTWNQVLHYLECHTVSNASAPNPRFDSPLPPYTSPSVELELELFDQQGPKREDSPLKIAVKAAPAQIIAALCHLGPEAARMADSRDRLPLHWACRRTSENLETDKVLTVLLKCYPEGLLQRDEGGRTPLHWLFWYHASSRSATMVEEFCQRLPMSGFDEIRDIEGGSPTKDRYPLPQIPVPNEKDEVPPSALIVHDAKHGALPLHYAVMQGATKQVLTVMLTVYPGSKARGDRRGRTALAWYLGAGNVIDNKKHVCGEANDPNATPWWHTTLSYSVVQLLLSSKVARTCDDLGRYPLHWACHLYALSWYFGNEGCLTIKMIQLLEDHYIQALTVKDQDGKTPLHICFDVIAEQQDIELKRNLSNHASRDNLDLNKGGPVAFTPPLQLIELLVKSPEADGQDVGHFRGDVSERAISAAFCEDPSGALPLHTALRVATAPDVIKLLIQTHPTSLVHTTEERLQTPLISALSSSFTAPLQQVETIELMMAAYVTSRHGTFMDGRLALKMEDAAGKYPIHYAAQNQSALQVLKVFVEKFPRSAMFQNSDGDLPVHCLLSQNHLFEPPENGLTDGASLAQPLGFLSEKEVTWHTRLRDVFQQKIRLLVEPLISAEHLRIGSSAHGMTPLHIAVAFDAVTYHTLYRMLDVCPDAARRLTSVKGYAFSCLDLHELLKNDCHDKERWVAVQELLFAFHPTLETYRRREELLDACVKLIRNEAEGKGSYHLTQSIESKSAPSIEISQTLSVIEVPEIDCAYRPKKQSKTTISQPKSKPKPALVAKNAPSKNEKSIYDDELGGGYVVSPENSEDEDDESFSSSSEEEYSSGDSGSEDDSFDGTSLANTTDPASLEKMTSGTDRSSWDRGPTDRSFETGAEEKKEESSKETSERYPQAENTPFFSDVAMRLWCFFVLFHDPQNPKDSYVKQVEAVLDGMDFGLVQRLVDIPVPLFAQEYLEPGTSVDGVTLRDVASPRPKAFIRSTHYFLGRYEFSNDKDCMLHRISGDDTFVIQGTEHILNTEEFCPAATLAPGVAEEAIWTRGEVIPEQAGHIVSKFGQTSKQVLFKLTRSQMAYENEVNCRLDLGLCLAPPGVQTFPTSHVLPLVTHYSAFGYEKGDRRYKMDVHDPRFKNLNVNFGQTVHLADYPYALVFPYSGEGDLFDYFYGRGIGRLDEVPDIAKHIATSLQTIHSKGVVLGRMGLRTVTKISLGSDDSPFRSWMISDFSTAYRIHAGTTYMGSVAHNGSPQFVTGMLPPEMFVILSENETSVYRTYWESVEKEYKVKLDNSVIRPRLNPKTGKSVVPRCHFVPTSPGASHALPTLPYKLLPVRESLDMWCFGQMLFTLCSGGHPLFPCNTKTGHLLEYETIGNWDKQAVASLIYEHIEDPLAQDILLLLLAPYADRAELKMETMLKHPFFLRLPSTSSIVQQVVDRRIQEKVAHERWIHQVAREHSDEAWLQERTVEFNCWNFETLSRFHFSVSEIVRKMVGPKFYNFAMPCSFIILPYKLSAKNKKAKLAPTTKKDVERAERMGVVLLSLSKTCHFALHIKNAVERAGSVQQWNTSKLLELLEVPTGDYELLKSDMMKLAAEHVEVFRTDPTIVAKMLVAKRVLDMKACFEDSKKGFLYLVDEYQGIPLVGPSYAPYPLEVTEGMIDQLLMKALPFMHICSLYVRGVAKSANGLVRLIFEAAYPHIPPSWGLASSGLSHTLDADLILKEASILQEALASMDVSTAKDPTQDLLFLRGYLLKFDAEKSFGHLKRVTCAGSFLWTTSDGEADLRDASESYGFKEAFEIQSALEAKLKSSEEKIRGLQSDLERLTFRNDLNLINFDVPAELPELDIDDEVSAEQPDLNAEMIDHMPASNPSPEIEDHLPASSPTQDAEHHLPASNPSQAVEDHLPGSKPSDESEDHLPVHE